MDLYALRFTLEGTVLNIRYLPVIYASVRKKLRRHWRLVPFLLIVALCIVYFLTRSSPYVPHFKKEPIKTKPEEKQDGVQVPGIDKRVYDLLYRGGPNEY